jgi:hypothetical protein
VCFRNLDLRKNEFQIAFDIGNHDTLTCCCKTAMAAGPLKTNLTPIRRFNVMPTPDPHRFENWSTVTSEIV